MSREVRVGQKVTLGEVQERFEGWRKRRRRLEPIPEGLWEAAVRLTEEHSIVHVSKCLRLNYTKLKERAGQTGPKGEPSGPRLVEVDFSSPGILAGQCDLEFEDRRGEKLKLSLKGKTDVDIVEVLRVLWSGAT